MFHNISRLCFDRKLSLQKWISNDWNKQFNSINNKNLLKIFEWQEEGEEEENIVEGNGTAHHYQWLAKD